MNILRLKRQNDMFAAAESHANNLHIAHCEAAFHSDFCKLPGSGSVPNIKVCGFHSVLRPAVKAFALFWLNDACNELSTAAELWISETRAPLQDLGAKETSIIERYKVKAVDKMIQELGAANDVLKLQRKEQLRELLKQERVCQEAELNAMGLAFNKLAD